MLKNRLLLFIIVLAVISFGLYKYFAQKKSFSKTEVGSEFTYYNLLNEIKFNLPNEYRIEDVTYPYGLALYKSLSDEFKRTKTESDFLKDGGIYIKAVRQIPGTKETFEVFMKQDFEAKLKQLGKTFTSEMFVTDQGYDAFKTVVTSPGKEVHVVVNTPIAFWLEAESNTLDFQKVYQAFKQFKPEEAIEVKKAASIQESFIQDLQEENYEQAESKMSVTLKNKFSVEKLQTTFSPIKERFNRQLRVFSIQTDGQSAVIRSTLEDLKSNQYAFLNTNLIQELNSWKIDRFVLNEDSPGLPYETAIKNVKKEIKKEDFLKKN